MNYIVALYANRDWLIVDGRLGVKLLEGGDPQVVKVGSMSLQP